MSKEERRADVENERRIGSLLCASVKLVEAEKQQSLLDGMKNGQKIAIDVGYQDKMTDFVFSRGGF